MRVKEILVIFCLAVVGVLGVDVESESATTEIEYDGSLALADDVTFSWKVEGDDILLKLKCPTTGWIGLGFPKSRTAHGMEDSDLIMGWVKEDKGHVLDAYAKKNGVPDVDEPSMQNVQLISSSEMDGYTKMVFKRPIMALNEDDVTIEKGQIVMLWAYGYTDIDGELVITDYHARRGHPMLTLIPMEGESLVEPEVVLGSPHSPHSPKDASDTESPMTSDGTGETESPMTTDGTGEAESPTTPDGTGEAESPSTPDESGGASSPMLPVETGKVESPMTPDVTGEAESSMTPDGTGEASSPMTPDGTGDAESPKTPDGTGEAESPMTPGGTGEAESPMTPDVTGEAESPMTPDVTAEAESPMTLGGTGDAESPMTPDGTGEAESPMTPDVTGKAKSPMTPDVTGEAESPMNPDVTGEAESPMTPAGTGDAESPMAPDGTGEAESPMTPDVTGEAKSQMTPDGTGEAESPMTPDGTGEAESPMTPDGTGEAESPMTPVEPARALSPKNPKPVVVPAPTVIKHKVLQGGPADLDEIFSNDAMSKSAVLSVENNVRLQWSYNTKYIVLQISIPTRGWIGVGVSPGPNMKGADIFITGIRRDGVYASDAHATGNGKPTIDKDQDVKVLRYIESGGYTSVIFARKLDTMDAMDMKIDEMSKYVIWAYGRADMAIKPRNFYHGTNRGAKMLTLINGPGGLPDDFVMTPLATVPGRIK